MSEHLIVNPEQLYYLYSIKDINDVYNEYTIFPTYKSVDKDIFYDILNCLSTKELQSLYLFIYKQWTLLKLDKELLNISTKRKKQVFQKDLPIPSSVTTINEFNNILKDFINDDKILGIYIMNQLLKFLYPCKV